MAKKPTFTLKARLIILLIASSILPIMLIWGFINYYIYSLYRQNTNMIIQNELVQIKANIDTFMNNMKYVSQQLVNDENLLRKIRENFSDISSIQRVNNIEYIKDQIIVYEISNPNVNNITFFYFQDDALQKLNTNSLVKTELPKQDYLLSTQTRLVYYGPHESLSSVGEYLVISLVRKLEILNSPALYLYIESDYNQISDFSTKTLDELKAIYTVISDHNDVVYSSDENRIKLFSTIPDEGEEYIDVNGNKYLSYRIDSDKKWSLQVFVPFETYNQYIKNLIFGFVITIVIAVSLSLLLYGFIWNSINHPFNIFTRNLDKILTDDAEAGLKTIYVKEFDRNFEYFQILKNKILTLVEITQQQEQEKSQLKIKQIFLKINPHFIHNTLDTLKWYSLKRGYTDVESFVSSLNRLLMYNMEKDQTTTLQSELLAVNDYIALQKLKYDIEYYTEIHLPAPMMATELPRFIMQPLVENAIFHGLEGRGSIWIRIYLLPNGQISIQIANDGKMLDKEKMEKILKSSEDLSSNGIGLQYVVSMLKAKFENSFQLQIQTENGENRIVINIPYSKGDYYAKDSNC